MSLRSRWERIRTVPGLGRDTAAIAGMVALGIVSTLGIQSYLSTGGLPWEASTTVKAEFEEVPGVNPDTGHVVTISGVRVGDVSDWEVTDRGTAVLTLNIDGERDFYQNARAVLRPKNPVNEMAVELNPGGPPAEPLPEDGVIPVAQTERPIQVNEVTQDLDERSREALTGLLAESDVALARAPEELPGGVNATHDTLTGMRPVVEQLEKRRDNISELVTALSQIAAAAGDNDERLARLMNATQDTLGVLASNDDELRASLDQLPGVTDELRTALTSTQRLTEELDPTLDNLNDASEQLPQALEKMRGTVGELDAVVESAAPVVDKAKPVVQDLRPLVADADDALDDVRTITEGLDEDTQIVASNLDAISAFIYNTSSVFGAGESKTEGIIRGHVALRPDAGLLPGGQGGWSPSPEESGIEEDN